jgi:hypothetical protein
VVYAKSNLSVSERLQAAANLARGGGI